jgi:hypothetical protein
MTRRLLTFLSIVTALILLTAALAAPVRVEGAALPPAKAATPDRCGSIDVHLGDGIVRLRVRTCEGCAPVLGLEITLPKVRIDWSPRS